MKELNIRCERCGKVAMAILFYGKRRKVFMDGYAASWELTSKELTGICSECKKVEI